MSWSVKDVSKKNYRKCWDGKMLIKALCFDNFSVYYIKVTHRKLTSWYTTHLLLKKAWMSQENK
jgi:hypothetical protein